MKPVHRPYNNICKTLTRCAPVLMTPVDTDPGRCAEERRAILRRSGVGQWQILGAHGMKKDYQVQLEK